jgi:MoaA/NifB/PqqE/SkfB family radical SAM enzyme
MLLMDATTKEKEGGAEVRLETLHDLWFLLGARCNLRCIHCYVASSPENDVMPFLTLAEVRGELAEAHELGVSDVYFTGGEPFLARDVVAMLEAALEAAPGDVTVLTNGTAPLARHFDALTDLRVRSAGRLLLRVSLDHYEEVRHDAIRGCGMFRETVKNVVALANRGFRPIVTATAEVLRGNPIGEEGVVREFTRLFAEHDARVDVKLLPSVLPMGSQLERIDAPPKVQALIEAALRARGVEPDALVRARGRSVLKRDGRIRVYPCPIIYDVPEYDLGGSLRESLAHAVALGHVACSTYCCKRGGNCTNR